LFVSYKSFAPIAPRPTERLQSFGQELVEQSKKMYTVYVLKDSVGKLYKGITNNLKRRLAEHKSGHTQSTKQLRNPVIVYTEEYDSFKQARKREIYFKTAAGRRFLKNILRP
jgi:putative endonuclease